MPVCGTFAIVLMLVVALKFAIIIMSMSLPVFSGSLYEISILRGLSQLAPLKLTEIPHSEFIDSNVNMKPAAILSSSYRLDSIVSLVLKEGRAKSKERVEKEKVKVNHSIVDEPSFIIDTGDIISVRGFGRFIVTEQIAETKKGKYRLEVMIVTDN